MNPWEQVLYYNSETEKARLKMVKAKKELDIVLSEISQQRKGLSNVNKKIDTRESLLSGIKVDIWVIKKELESGRINFYKTTSEQDKYLNSLNNKVFGLGENLKKVSEDIDIQNSKVKDIEKLEEYKVELENKISKIESDSIEKYRSLEKREKKIAIEEEELQAKKESIRKTQTLLNKREKNLIIRENRYKKIKLNK